MSSKKFDIPALRSTVTKELAKKLHKKRESIKRVIQKQYEKDQVILTRAYTLKHDESKFSKQWLQYSDESSIDTFKSISY